MPARGRDLLASRLTRCIRRPGLRRNPRTRCSTTPERLLVILDESHQPCPAARPVRRRPVAQGHVVEHGFGCRRQGQTAADVRRVMSGSPDGLLSAHRAPTSSSFPQVVRADRAPDRAHRSEISAGGPRRGRSTISWPRSASAPRTTARARHKPRRRCRKTSPTTARGSGSGSGTWRSRWRRERLPRPGDAEQRLEPVAPLHARDQGIDRFGLVAGGRESVTSSRRVTEGIDKWGVTVIPVTGSHPGACSSTARRPWPEGADGGQSSRDTRDIGIRARRRACRPAPTRTDRRRRIGSRSGPPTS